MGLVYSKITLSNPTARELKTLEVKALADTGAVFLIIPEHIALQLQLEANDKVEVTLADEGRVLIPQCGPVRIDFSGRHCHTDALIMGDEVLLGVIPMEAMDLVVVPQTRELMVNPQSPNFPSVKAKATHA